MAQRAILLILKPIALAGGFGHHIGREAGRLGVRSAVNHVPDVVGFVQEKREFERLPMHQGGMFLRGICLGSELGAAFFSRYPLGHGEGPVHGVQLGMAIHAAVVPDVGPSDGTEVTDNVPLLLPLQELETGWPRLVYRGGSNAAWSGWDTAVGLNLGGFGAVICCQVVSFLDETVAVAGHRPIGGSWRAPGEETEQRE